MARYRTLSARFREAGDWERPAHAVLLARPFYLGRYEVTQAQYQRIMGSNPSSANKDPNCPADTVGEGDATDFDAQALFAAADGIIKFTEKKVRRFTGAFKKAKFANVIPAESK